jgi:hypothetical protein
MCCIPAAIFQSAPLLEDLAIEPFEPLTDEKILLTSSNDWVNG